MHTCSLPLVPAHWFTSSPPLQTWFANPLANHSKWGGGRKPCTVLNFSSVVCRAGFTFEYDEWRQMQQVADRVIGPQGLGLSQGSVPQVCSESNRQQFSSLWKKRVGSSPLRFEELCPIRNRHLETLFQEQRELVESRTSEAVQLTETAMFLFYAPLDSSEEARIIRYGFYQVPCLCVRLCKPSLPHVVCP